MDKADPNPYSPAAIKRIMGEYEISAKKSLGQNFLVCPKTAAAIVDFSGVGKEDTVIEVGFGFGALTLLLCERAKEVIVFEIDRKLAELALNHFNLPQNLKIFNSDFLKTKLSAFIEPGCKIVSNLPYSSSSQMLFKILEHPSLFTDATLTFQKEMALRILSTPGNKSYGTLSVISSLCADIEAGPELNPIVFFPKPDVNSQVLRFSPKKISMIDKDLFGPFCNFLKTLFQYRRKQILNTLKNALALPAEGLLKVLHRSKIDPRARLETLYPATIYALYTEICQTLPMPKRFTLN